MARVTYAATFANGDRITRTTERSYSHAWRATTKDGRIIQEGFAGSAALAHKAAANAAAMNDGKVEVVPAAIVPEGFEKLARRALPWRVEYTYPNDRGRRNFAKGSGSQHLRFATRDEAQTKADAMNTASAKRGAAIVYTPTDE